MGEPTKTTDAGEPAIELTGVSYAYPEAPVVDGRRARALSNVSLTVAQGERLGILGPNGGGKSTLLGILLGVIDGYEGGARVLGMPPDRARREGIVGAVPQKTVIDKTVPLNAVQAVRLGARRDQRVSARDAMRALELVEAVDIARRAIGKLSGGQLQRALIARALVREPRILVLDEPMVGVDVVGQQRFAGLLTRLHDELGLTIVVVSHDLRSVASGCDRVACLNRTLHSHSSPAGLTPEVLAEVFEHDLAPVFGDVHLHAHKAEDCPSHDHGPGCPHDHGGGS